MRKKMIALGLTVCMGLSAGTTAFAAHPCNFVDADGDGICDNGDTHCSFVDADGDGVCDNGDTHCSFVDADGDGICDNGDTHCSFVDADGDSICDSCAMNHAHHSWCRGNGQSAAQPVTQPASHHGRHHRGHGGHGRHHC